MPEQDDKTTVVFSMRLTVEQMERIDWLVEQVEARSRRGTEASRKSVLMAGVAMLEAYYERLEADKQRDR